MSRVVFSLLVLLAAGGQSYLADFLHDLYLHCPFTDFHERHPAYAWNNSEARPCCGQCVSGPDCGVRAPCCPDYRLQPQVHSTCLSDIYKTENVIERMVKGYQHHYWMVDTCLPMYTNTLLENRCRHRQLDTFWNTTSVRPVLDNLTNVIYANVDCARCNDAEDNVSPDFFYSTIHCVAMEKSLGVFRSASMYDSLLQLGLCFLQFIPTSDDVVSVSICDPVAISSCNVTGQWDAYNQTIADACSSYHLTYIDDEMWSQIVYKNVHCYICNRETAAEGPEGLCANIGFIQHLPTFSVVIVGTPYMTEPVLREASDNCSTAELYDPHKGECRALVCPGTKLMTADGCRQVVTAGNDVVWGLHVLWTVTDKKLLEMTYHENLITGRAVEFLTDRLFRSRDGDLRLLAMETYFGSSNTTAWVLISADFLSNTEDGTAHVLEFIAKHHGKDSTREKHFINGTTIVLESWIVHEDSIVHMRQVLEVYGRRLHQSYEYVSINRWDFPTDTITLSKLMTCDQVLLREYEYNISDYGILTLSKNKLALSDIEYFTDGGAVYVCVTDFLYSGPTRNLSNYSTSSLTKSIISYIMSALSIVGLCLLIITYLLFKSLRNTTGHLHTCLCISMILSQFLQQFPPSHTKNKEICVILGILGHFFPLNTTFWIHICSFREIRRIKGFKLGRRCCGKYLISWCVFYSSIASSLLVGLNLLISLLNSNLSDLGYGGTVCELSAFNGKLYFLIIPSETVLLGNMAFLLFDLFSHLADDMPATFTGSGGSGSQITFLVVSVLGAGHWACQGFYLWRAYDVFTYLALVLGTAQVACLVVSFCLTQPVLALYVKLLCGDKKKETED